MSSEIIIINPEEADERLDKVLANRYSELHSRTYFQYLIEQNSVLVNGELVKKRQRLEEGDEIQINFILTPEIKVEPEPIPLDILYEDDDIIVVNKPPGLVVHPAPGNWTGTFVNALLYHCKEIEPGGSLRPGIVHRLDKDTSGVLVAAKSLLAHQRLIEMFSGRTVAKQYLAICSGNPGNRTINAPIGRHPVDRKRMTVIEKGRQAITHCKTLAARENLSLVRLDLETGRTHQIRVHLKSVNAPVLGDSAYGSESINRRYGANRQMLHAEKLAFKHPISGKTLEFRAEPPQDMKELIKKLGLSL